MNRPCSTHRATIFLVLPVIIATGAALSRHAPCAEKREPSALKTIHLAAGQIVCGPGDIAGNLRQIRRLAGEAAKAGARLCLFAEGAITGYVLTGAAMAAAPRADGPVAQRLRQMAIELKMAVAAGTLERGDDGVHVSCFVALPDGRMVVQRKHQLTGGELKAGLLPGPVERTLFNVDSVTMAVCICADSGIPGIQDRLAAQGCQVFLLPTAGGGGREHIFHPADLEDPARRAAYVKLMDQVCSVSSAVGGCIDHRMSQLAVNLSGDDGIDHYHPGHASIIDSRGRIVALLPGEYVIDYLEPRMIHGLVIVQTPRTTTAGKGTKTCPR
ncbi:MAG: carbon-nitrogen hydrolase family protein [Thermoguttaceae bacterium]